MEKKINLITWILSIIAAICLLLSISPWVHGLVPYWLFGSGFLLLLTTFTIYQLYHFVHNVKDM